MLIWACPPMQGDDYIMYCHPNKQKIPRSDRLRAWYLDMLRAAREERIVARISTLWDTFFEGGRDHRLERVTAAAIPYLEGDYWPGEAENVLLNLAAAASGQAAGKKGGSALVRKAGKGKRYGPGASTDDALMGHLGEVLGGNMREDFIVVHFQEPCQICRAHVNGGTLFQFSGVVPKAPSERKFEGLKLEPASASGQAHVQICGGCHAEECRRQAEGGRLRLPGSLTPGDLRPVKTEALPPARDPDPDAAAEIFDTRQAYLSLCQGNRFQYDTLRRAKHSSMMTLYHLHNPSAPAFTSTCNLCTSEIEAGSGFRCTVCPDFDICAACRGSRGHEHPLQAHTRQIDELQQRLSSEEMALRQAALQRTMALIVHAFGCPGAPACPSQSCKRIRQLAQHAHVCAVKVAGGCPHCKRMWGLLNLHAKSCISSSCPVPRCRELKDLRRAQIVRKEQQRRLAYSAMMRQQAAGGAGGD